jgi:hypothetical protein
MIALCHFQYSNSEEAHEPYYRQSLLAKSVEGDLPPPAPFERSTPIIRQPHSSGKRPFIARDIKTTPIEVNWHEAQGIQDIVIGDAHHTTAHTLPAYEMLQLLSFIHKELFPSNLSVTLQTVDDAPVKYVNINVHDLDLAKNICQMILWPMVEAHSEKPVEDQAIHLTNYGPEDGVTIHVRKDLYDEMVRCEKRTQILREPSR